MKIRIMVAALGLALAACSGGEEASAAQESPSAPAQSGAQTLPIPSVGNSAAEGATHGAGPLTWNVPSGWSEVAPSNNMRQAQFEVSGSAGTAECVVFYFGPGQGGDPMANAQRWAGQFRQPDGSDSLAKMKMQDLDGGSLPLKLVEVTGTYDGGMSTGIAPADSMDGWMLLGGIAEGPDAPWFFKFTGPQATVEENREAFVSLLRSIRQEI